MQDISIISMIFTAALALACLYLLIAPFFKWDTKLGFNTKTQEMANTKETLLTTLNEIEFEYKMDKISETDYKVLKKQYESQVASIIREEEQFTETKIDKDILSEVEREIEEQMLKMKKKKEGGK